MGVNSGNHVRVINLAGFELQMPVRKTDLMGCRQNTNPDSMLHSVAD
jgi:hypothetical protein